MPRFLQDSCRLPARPCTNHQDLWWICIIDEAVKSHSMPRLHAGFFPDILVFSHSASYAVPPSTAQCLTKAPQAPPRPRRPKSGAWRPKRPTRPRRQVAVWPSEFSLSLCEDIVIISISIIVFVVVVIISILKWLLFLLSLLLSPSWSS